MCVRAHADVNKIGLVERLKGLVLGIKGFLCIVYVCESNCLRERHTVNQRRLYGGKRGQGGCIGVCTLLL